ncbi:hypothetical protein EXN22_16110 [Pseudomonas tructae]|uniref:Uncharacterized protein n=1 Tax=Pseudomonas tructae TaxID=2518644 RepID=A0A411MK16_9PSED|nr:hypothetical protein [Pseudomonas tructae]QBF27143.1 hypothetical protein EXN22_16110 [Pseudomonas tructae]
MRASERLKSWRLRLALVFLFAGAGLVKSERLLGNPDYAPFGLAAFFIAAVLIVWKFYSLPDGPEQ